MKLTKTRLKKIIREELKILNEAMDPNEKERQITRIHDEFVGFLETEELYPPGGIPLAVERAIDAIASRIVDGMPGIPPRGQDGGEEGHAPGEQVDPFHGVADPWRAKMGPR